MSGVNATPDPFGLFKSRQTTLNQFLWTTELIYGLVKHKRLLNDLPQDRRAADVLANVVSEAWFPNDKGEIKYRGTIGDMRTQLDANFRLALLNVAMLFVAEYEVYVERRFPRWASHKTRNGQRVLMIPAPTALLKDLDDFYDHDAAERIEASVTLKADLMKKIRNLYAHRGIDGIPRSVDDVEIVHWGAKVRRDDPATYSEALVTQTVNHVIGAAVAKSRAARRAGKTLGEEFFYALFTFTNIRNFVNAVEAAFQAHT
jgi:hypothetical protein